uniref:Family with sequence similarity 83 member E n=1 Tax=Chelydra serpentina TaxID=8475 RepID=A0A8C3SF17_CHESE
MAASQLDCLEDAPPGTPLTESSPEFFYSEGQRLAVEALLAGGQSAYAQRLAQDRLRPFLSDDELRHLAEAARDIPEPVGERDGDADELSLSYWPGCSDEPVPNLELGWPLDGNWKGITRAEVYTHPPGDGAPKVKELVRRKIQQAAKVVAIVMDVFTDPDILLDLHEAGMQRGVPVYLILGEQHLAAFLSMAEGASLNVRYMEVRPGPLVLRWGKGTSPGCWRRAPPRGEGAAKGEKRGGRDLWLGSRDLGGVRLRSATPVPSGFDYLPWGGGDPPNVALAPAPDFVHSPFPHHHPAQNLRVRVIAGCTFWSRKRKQVTGTLKEKFLLIDGDTVITGSYR